MKQFIFLSFFLSHLICRAQSDTSFQFTTGIVYGPKAAYRIDAAPGWILDNQSGMSMDLPCVLYLKGYSWEDSPVIMYAKIAGTKVEDMEKFMKWTLDQYLEEDPDFKSDELKRGEVNEIPYVIMNYQGGPYDSWERTAYFQMDQAVGYIVFSARNEEDFEKYADALLYVMRTMVYLGVLEMK